MHYLKQLKLSASTGPAEQAAALNSTATNLTAAAANHSTADPDESTAHLNSAAEQVRQSLLGCWSHLRQVNHNHTISWEHALAQAKLCASTAMQWLPSSSRDQLLSRMRDMSGDGVQVSVATLPLPRQRALWTRQGDVDEQMLEYILQHQQHIRAQTVPPTTANCTVTQAASNHSTGTPSAPLEQPSTPSNETGHFLFNLLTVGRNLADLGLRFLQPAAKASNSTVPEPVEPQPAASEHAGSVVRETIIYMPPRPSIVSALFPLPAFLAETVAAALGYQLQQQPQIVIMTAKEAAPAACIQSADDIPVVAVPAELNSSQLAIARRMLNALTLTNLFGSSESSVIEASEMSANISSTSAANQSSKSSISSGGSSWQQFLPPFLFSWSLPTSPIANDARNETTSVVQPTKADGKHKHAALPTSAMTELLTHQMRQTIAAALAIQSDKDCQAFLQHFNVQNIITYLLGKEVDKLDAMRALNKVLKYDAHLADSIGSNALMVQLLCEQLEAPYRGFKTFLSTKDKDREHRLQLESLACVQRLVRSSETATTAMASNSRLRKALLAIISADTPAASAVSTAANKTTTLIDHGLNEDSSSSLLAKAGQQVKHSTKIVEYANLRPVQMARIAAWGLGGVPWKPKQPNQKGLRILSLDGGGTRGVLTVAYLKELFTKINANQAKPVNPFEAFDIICGTSTGGIIAMLLGGQCRTLDDAEVLYDEFIEKIFASRSNYRLVTEQAAYDEKEFEKILFAMAGNMLLLDTNVLDCARVFCVSTMINSNPPQAKIWRNYNYPSGQSSRYAGSFRINTMSAIRATTAAPTFFTPVQWEGGLFADGALVANNPTAIALQEAKVLFPGVPVELVVSIGTGTFSDTKSNLRSMGWNLLVNQLVASTTDTEDVHSLLVDFLPKDKYFRFNPAMKESFAIDEKDKTLLLSLKQLARDHFQDLEKTDPKRYEQLFRTLRGNNK